MDFSNGSNRRRLPRLQYPCLVRFGVQGSSQGVFSSHTQNLGMGGAAVICFEPLKEASLVNVAIDPLDSDERIVCRGKVAWSHRRAISDPDYPLSYDVGIEFEEMREEAVQLMSRIMERAGEHPE